jgi:predicted nucleotide-binding protein (sugar kinase/HSP70/actin superfamily)
MSNEQLGTDTTARWKSLEKVRVVSADQLQREDKRAKAAGKWMPQVPPVPQTATNGRLDHYRAYKPRPFTRAERARTTILFGGLHWRAERVIQGTLENLGYKSQILPTATRADLLTGREVADIGQCCPTSFTTGNLANYLRGEAKRIGGAEVAEKYVYVTAGSCGACRFGQYHQSYELALRNVGMESFRLFLLDQGNLDQGAAEGGGLEIDLPFTLGAVWSLIVSDIVQDLEYQTRPYEVNAGETVRVARECVELLYEAFRKRPARGKKLGAVAWHLGTDYFVKAMREVRRRFDAMEVDRTRVKPLVKITGEFYLQTVEGDPNYNIHRWLETEGAEVYPASISIWLDYLLRLAGQDFYDRIGIDKGARLKYGAVRALQAGLRWTHNRMRAALNDVPRPMPDQYELRKLAAPYYHSRLNGGEGDMLVGKALWAYLHKKAHMICELSPYSCMPNTMSIGAMSGVIGKYPDLLYAPLEIKGDAEVHALSRCQMILTEAKKRAQREFDEVMQRTGLNAATLRAAVDARPELKLATRRIPHYGVAGTAANLALHVAAGRH